jgi:ADP-ribose pyrophosphatase YjhB (NUDIX family)
MEYNLSNPKRKRIFQQFLYHKKLRFSELLKLTQIRSNELAYFISMLCKEEVIEKRGEQYYLSKEAERQIPFYIDSDEKQSPLPVILVACHKDGKVLLVKRKKRPYDGLWSLIGGRIRMDENLAGACTRVAKELTFIDCFIEKTRAVMLEKSTEDTVLKHSFLIVFVTAIPKSGIIEKENIKWFKTTALPKAMIPSDKWLVENKMSTQIDLLEEEVDKIGNDYKLRFMTAEKRAR